MEMELQETKHQIKLEQWGKLVYKCRNSGLTVKRWCLENHISIQTYYRWQKLVWEAGIEKTALKPIPAKEIIFAEYHPQITSANTPTLTVHFGEISLEIQNGAAPETIEATLRALKSLQSLC